MTSMGKKSKAIKNIPVFIAVVLLGLTLLSSYPATGVLARYSTTGQSSDHARVARFSVDLKGEDGKEFSQFIEDELIPGGSSDGVPIIVTNDSEVTVEYTVEVENVTGNLPLNAHLEKQGDSGTPETVNVSDTPQQLPGGGTDNYTLHIDWEITEGDLARIGMVDYFKVTVTAAQAD